MSSANILTQAITFLPQYNEAFSNRYVSFLMGRSKIRLWCLFAFKHLERHSVFKMHQQAVILSNLCGKVLVCHNTIIHHHVELFLIRAASENIVFFGIVIFNRNESLQLWRRLSRESLVEPFLEYSLYLSKKINTLLLMRNSFRSFLSHQ